MEHIGFPISDYKELNLMKLAHPMYQKNVNVDIYYFHAETDRNHKIFSSQNSPLIRTSLARSLIFEKDERK